MKKWDGPSLSWTTPHTTPFFLPHKDPFPVLLRHNSTPLREPDPALARRPRQQQAGTGHGSSEPPAERAHASITPYVDSPNLPTAIAQHKMSSTCAYAKINTRELENTGQLSAADHSSTFRLCATSSWRIHCGVEVTELITNKQHSLSHAQRAKHCSLDCENIHKFVHSM